MARVSVVIPCFNHGRYIDQAVESVLSQTYQDFEIVIVDDGSTDEFTRELLESYSRPKTRVIRTENRGPAAARNTGIRETTGECILTLDADDVFLPTFLEKAIAILDHRPEVGAVGSWIQAFGAENDIRRPSGGSVADFLVRNVCPYSALSRRVCWEQAGGYDEAIKLGYEDWDFWLSVTESGWLIEVISEALLRYRVSRASRFASCRADRLGHVECVLRKHERSLSQHAVQVALGKEALLAEKDEVLDCIVNSRPYRIGCFILSLGRPLKKLAGFVSKRPAEDG